MQRTSKQYIIMAISFGTALSVFPFLVFRLIQQDWLISLVDFFIVCGMLAVGIYVYITGKTTASSVILTIIALGGLCGVVYLKGPALIYWAYPSMLIMYFVLTPRLALIFGGITALLLIPILAKNLETLLFTSIFISLLTNNFFAYIFASGMRNQRDLLRILTRLDPLTNAGNRRALDEKLGEAILAVNRRPQPMSLIAIDIDHFKRINDNFGHATGDQVLVNLVKLIDKRIRKTDSLYRLGGEEFVVLAMGAGMQAVKQLAENLRNSVELESLIKEQTITISLGVAEYIEKEEAIAWLDRADKALYKAKQNGRNVVFYAD